MPAYQRVLAAACFILGAARASALPSETIVDALPSATPPVLAIDPVTGEPHVAFVNNDTLYHAWRSGGAWQDEPVASSVFRHAAALGDEVDLRIAPDGRIYALYVQPGSVVFAQRGPGGWEPTPLDAPIGFQFKFGTLAVSPVTGEPVAAWASRPAADQPFEVKIARRSSGNWTTQVLDTTSATLSSMVAVAVDASDRPRVAWARPRADGVASNVLTCALASGPTGPYVAAPVDSEFVRSASLALDPVSGEPRIAYPGRSVTGQGSIRYAALDGGSWQTMSVQTASGSNFPPPSLAIDPAGDPYLAMTEYTDVGPATVRGGDDPGQGGCVLVQTGDVLLRYRHGGAGTGAFTTFTVLQAPDGFDDANGVRTLIAPVPGAAAAAWRSPGADNCTPFAQVYALSTPFAGVEPGPDARVAMGPIRPNPARVGASLQAVFELPRAADVAYELHDVVGRIVASRTLGVLDAGPHALVWAPSAPGAGMYWLTLRADGARLGTRAVVLAR